MAQRAALSRPRPEVPRGMERRREAWRGCPSRWAPRLRPMGAEVHLWQVAASDQLNEIVPARLDLESRLQEWLARDVSILDPALLVIGREVETDFGGFIDILCVDAEGDL